MNEDVLSAARAWLTRGERVAMATVVDFKRSAPRAPGSKMAIGASGTVAGSVSGGCVEGAVVSASDQVLTGGPPRLLKYGIEDQQAWDIGLPCGGEIDVWLESYAPGRFEEVVAEGGRAAQVTLLAGASPGGKLVVEPGGRRTGGLGAPELDEEAARLGESAMWSESCSREEALFVEVVAPPPRLILFGAVDIAASVCRLARDSGWRCYVIDPRAQFATRERFPDADEVIAAWPSEGLHALGALDPATSVAVLTHDPKLDDAALKIALRSPARFVGAMGSRRTQAARRERLVAAGLDGSELSRLSAPVGLDLGASSQEETALSILAEVVAARHGRSGGRLSQTGAPIHGDNKAGTATAAETTA